MKPQRLVMSMVPNKSYLQGYNTCLDDTEAYQEKVAALMLKVLNAGFPAGRATDEEMALRTEVAELLELG
jgi:hypothetical protein